jgi:hypothetical protein
MSMSFRTTALAAMVASLGIGGGAAQVIPRPPRQVDAAGGLHRETVRIGNNKAPGPSRAKKRRLRKIARASRRYNLRCS